MSSNLIEIFFQMDICSLKRGLIRLGKSKFRILILIFSLYVIHVIQTRRGDLTFYICLHICAGDFIELLILLEERQQIMFHVMKRRQRRLKCHTVTYAACLTSPFFCFCATASVAQHPPDAHLEGIWVLHKALQSVFFFSHCQESTFSILPC